MILSSEAVNRDILSYNAKLMEFLGLPNWKPVAHRRLHSTPYGEINQKTRDQLVAYYRPHNERLYELLGEDLGWQD